MFHVKHIYTERGVDSDDESCHSGWPADKRS